MKAEHLGGRPLKPEETRLDPSEAFGRHRPLLFSIAYGMLGRPDGFVTRRARVSGRPGLIGYFGDGNPQSVATLEVVDGSIRAIRLVANPEKLRFVPPLYRIEDEETPR